MPRGNVDHYGHMLESSLMMTSLLQGLGRRSWDNCVTYWDRRNAHESDVPAQVRYRWSLSSDAAECFRPATAATERRGLSSGNEKAPADRFCAAEQLFVRRNPAGTEARLTGTGGWRIDQGD